MKDPLDSYVERSVEAVLQEVLPGWVDADQNDRQTPWPDGSPCTQMHRDAAVKP
jgi:hypothetical protein